MTSLKNLLTTEIPLYTEDVIRAALKTDMGEQLVWIVVEDNDDVNLYEQLFLDSTTRILNSADKNPKTEEGVLKGCEHVEKIVSAILKDFRHAKVCGIRDTDYTRFLTSYICPEAIFHTEQRDLEMMMVAADSVKNALQNWNKNFLERIKACAETTRQLGYIRIYNDVANLGVKIERVVKSKDLWDQNRHSVKEGWYDTAIQQMNTKNAKASKENLQHLIEVLSLEQLPYENICQGHDFIRLLQLMMIQNHIYSYDAIMKRMTEAYSVEDFKQTALYRALEVWRIAKDWPSIFR